MSGASAPRGATGSFGADDYCIVARAMSLSEFHATWMDSAGGVSAVGVEVEGLTFSELDPSGAANNR